MNNFHPNNDRRDRRAPAQMYQAICSQCGQDCQVPFKPSGNKPIYCSNCYQNNKPSRPRFDRNTQNNYSSNRFSNHNQSQTSQILQKLDKIIELLETKSTKKKTNKQPLSKKPKSK